MSARRSKVRKAAEKAGFRSGFEHAVAAALERDGGEVRYEEDKLSYEVSEVRTYTPDFKLAENIYVECKGRLTAQDRKKMLLVKAQHPDKEFRLLFQFDNKLNPRSKTRYSTWAEKNGFQYAVGDIPKEWIK